MPIKAKRRRASAIVQHPQGIVLVLMRHLDAMLPGGGVHDHETEQDGVLRELLEETGLVAQEATFLFQVESSYQTNAVFWVLAPGTPQPHNEIDAIAYFPDPTLRLSSQTQLILRRFQALQADEPARFARPD